MVVKVAAPGRSFAGVAAYCLHDTREPGEPQPETSKRVEWTDTRNLPTDRPDRAAAMMAAAAQAMGRQWRGEVDTPRPTLKSWSGSPPDSRHHPESGGTLTPRVVVVVDPERSYGLVFGHSRSLCPLGGVSLRFGCALPYTARPGRLGGDHGLQVTRAVSHLVSASAGSGGSAPLV